MTGRPYDWNPLAASDPVPGDPVEMAALGRRFRDTAAEIHSSCARLRSMCTDQVWDSDAGQAFRSHCDDSAGKLSKAYARYEAAGTALGTDAGDAAPPTPARPNYAGALGHAQSLSARALSTAQDAAATQQHSLSWLRSLYDQGSSQTLAASGLTMPGSRFPSTSYVSPGTIAQLESDTRDTAEEAAAKRRYNTACEDLTAAQRTLAEATQLRDTAAAYASDLISGVIDHDGLGDSFWDHVTNLIDEHAGFIAALSQAMGWIASVCGFLALVTGWIPGIGPVLAAALGTVALIASVVQLISDVLLEIGGKGSLFDLAMDVIAVTSFGLGRAASGAVKDSALLARGAGITVKAENDLMLSDAWLKGGEEGLQTELPKAWNTVSKELGEMGDGYTEAVSHGSGLWPKWGGILRGFNPVSILKDGFGGVGDLKLSAVTSLLQREGWKGAKIFVGDPEIRAAVQGIGEDLKNVAGEPAVHSYLANVDSNRNMWRYVTVPAVVADWTNHVLTISGEREQFLDGVGLGWAK